MSSNARACAGHFCFEGELLDVRPHGSGHINETFVVETQAPDGLLHRYVLQRLNRDVFERPEEVMENIERVTLHLRDRILRSGGDPWRETVNLVRTKDGASFHRTSEGEYWRAALWVEGAHTHETAESPDQLYSAARAFGRFQKMLSDFPIQRLHTTILGFHDTPRRFDAFIDAVEQDVESRARHARAEIEFIERRGGDVASLVTQRERGELPERVVHNDAKLNNVMIDDETGEAVCVIDLDTVMPGLAVLDFGDTVRSGASHAAEDERDLSKVGLDLQAFDAIARGYLEATRGFLTDAELDVLPDAARLITLEQGMRFLTDYLCGDVYYRVHQPAHNLDRCRTQLELVRDMEAKRDELRSVIDAVR
jgi:Ser/Thr protein kinase RdoA (MazF antagonist)